MRKFWLFGVTVLGLCLVAGCEPHYWYREGTSFDEARADWEGCEAELQKRADLNYVSDYERRYMVTCMEQKGYRLVSSSDLPLDARRVEPNLATAVPWDHFYGLAGSLPE